MPEYLTAYFRPTRKRQKGGIIFLFSLLILNITVFNCKSEITQWIIPNEFRNNSFYNQNLIFDKHYFLPFHCYVSLICILSYLKSPEPESTGCFIQYLQAGCVANTRERKRTKEGCGQLSMLLGAWMLPFVQGKIPEFPVFPQEDLLYQLSLIRDHLRTEAFQGPSCSGSYNGKIIIIFSKNEIKPSVDINIFILWKTSFFPIVCQSRAYE